MYYKSLSFALGSLNLHTIFQILFSGENILPAIFYSFSLMLGIQMFYSRLTLLILLLLLLIGVTSLHKQVTGNVTHPRSSLLVLSFWWIGLGWGWVVLD